MTRTGLGGVGAKQSPPAGSWSDPRRCLALGGPAGGGLQIAVDAAFTKAMGPQLTPVLRDSGGTLPGAVRHPPGTLGFS